MFCLWLFIHNGVPTKTFLCSRGIFIPRVHFCNHDYEDIYHLFKTWFFLLQFSG